MLDGEVGVVAVCRDVGRGECEHVPPELTVSPCGYERLGQDLPDE